MWVEYGSKALGVWQRSIGWGSRRLFSSVVLRFCCFAVLRFCGSAALRLRTSGSQSQSRVRSRRRHAWRSRFNGSYRSFIHCEIVDSDRRHFSFPTTSVPSAILRENTLGYAQIAILNEVTKITPNHVRPTLTAHFSLTISTINNRTWSRETVQHFFL